MPEFVIQLIPLMNIQGLLLIGVIPLARKVSPGGAWAWIVAALLPLVGGMVFMFLMMNAMAVILDRLDLLSGSGAAAYRQAATARRSPSGRPVP